MSKWGMIAKAHVVETGAAPLIDLRTLYAAFATDIADNLIELRAAVDSLKKSQEETPKLIEEIKEHSVTIHTAIAMLFPKIQDFFESGKLKEVSVEEFESAKRVYEYTFNKRSSFEDNDLFNAAKVVLVFLVRAGILDVFKAKRVGMADIGGEEE